MSNDAMRVVASAALLSLAIHAHGSEPASAAQSCAAVAEPAERLGCYDRMFPPEVDAISLAEKANAEFGLSKAEAQSRNPALAAPAGAERIEAAVLRVSDGLRSERVITLDNGQVWRQSEASSLGSVVEGDRVTIRKGSFSSYQLVTPGGVPLRVRRLK